MASEKRDTVTLASMDSFPASDPPGWIRTSASTTDEVGEQIEVVDISDGVVGTELADTETSATSGPELRRIKNLAIASLAGGLLLAGGLFLVRRLRA